MSGLGGFGALCELPNRYKEPVLVSGTDGVGTKLKLAMEFGKHDTIGIDLVAMCVNDLIVTGAEPLIFLDYLATGKLDVETAAQVVAGIGAGCEQAGCALVGGETAEMPGMYQGSDYDLAGFCVGVAEKSKIIDGSSIRVGDVLIGLPSSGVHSNGYSLVRKVLEERNIDAQKTDLGGQLLSDLLIEPTRIYVKPILQLMKNVEIRAIAHITGGGITENVPRVLQDSIKAVVNRKSWEQPAIFNWLQEQANISDQEMERTFNCGIGLVLVVPEADAGSTVDLLHAMGEEAFQIGEIQQLTEGEEQIEIYR
ncbi:UNVERIFIED_CONTAM: hypothetical protein GTU68_045166 [Idotea baltica]|nr:hypothetical protein [Idotea baltica]